MSKNNYHLALKVSWINLSVNLFLSVLKFIIGFTTNSISVLSDAVDSLGDVFTASMIIVSLNVSNKPADKDHPYGHGRVEDIGGLVFSLFLIIVGINFFKDAAARLIFPKPVTVSYIAIAIILVNSFVKLFLGFFTQKVSQKESSSLLKTDSMNYYGDFLRGIVIFIGLFFVRNGYTIIDSLLGMAISVVIVFMAQKMFREFIDSLIGKAAPLDFYEKIKDIARSFKVVEGVHDIEVHSYGKNKIILLHIEMSSSLSLEEAHSVADSIEKKIYQDNLGRAIVHMDLKGKTASMEKMQIETAIKMSMALSPKIKDFHGMEIISTETGDILNFHLWLDKDTSLSESHSISHKLAEILKEKFHLLKVNIHIEPDR